MKKYSKAFTLIELLVVIAIIGILAGMILVSVGKARAKARDTQRKNDLAQMQKALAMYYADNESYPVDYDDLSKLVPIYIKAIPTDPSGGLYSYTPSPSGCTGTGCSAFTISTPNPLETDTTHTWEVTESSASAVVAGNSNANSGNENTNSTLDITPPTFSGNISISYAPMTSGQYFNIYSNNITLSWSAATDIGSGLDHYIISGDAIDYDCGGEGSDPLVFLNGGFIAAGTTTTTIQPSNLGSTFVEYHCEGGDANFDNVYITAYDKAGNFTSIGPASGKLIGIIP